MSTNSAMLIYRAALASFVNPVYEAKQQAEAEHVVERITVDDQGRPLSPVQRIEKYFSLIDTHNNRKVTAQDLASAWISHVTNPTDNDLQLIAREIDSFMKLADLDQDGYVSLNEYLHYMLTLIKEKEEGKRFEIHGLLAEKTSKDRALVDKLLTWFLEKDVAGVGEISINDFKQILDKVKIKEKKRLQIDEAVFSQRTVNYSQYIMLMLGRTPTKVSLISYDISGNATKNLSRILFGKKIEGIWHTSILAFGYEWWFGGDCFQSRPFSTPFGPTPDKVQDLGDTTRSLQELKDFIKTKMRKKYNYTSYDVIKNNCNNFTNDISYFLVHKGIPRSIVSLPGDLLSGGLAKLMRPFLNKWLGGFTSDEINQAAGNDILAAIRQEKSEAHSDLQVGDIAMWKRTETEHIFCEIMEIRKDGKIRIKIFKNLKFKTKLIKDKSYISKIPKDDMKEHEASINYLIALSILETQRNSTDKLLMRQITEGLLDGLITGENNLAVATSSRGRSHRLSVIAPGGISDDDGGQGEEYEDQPNACRSCWNKVCRNVHQTS
jgi:Ca2+-binding EF-hand superfamily protein